MKTARPQMYQDFVSKGRQALKTNLSLPNVMQVPQIEKVVLNIGVTGAVSDSKQIAKAVKGLAAIAQQQPVIRKARKSIAGFKIREGMEIGVSVTLRNDRMYDFLQKLIHLALPRVRDFQGVTRKLDGQGNYNLGIKEWIIFPEIEDNGIDKAFGLNITVCTSASNDAHAYALLQELGMPFAKEAGKK